MSETTIPKTIAWLRGLSIFQVVVSVFGVAIFIWLATLDHSTLTGFWKGFSNGVNGGPVTPEDAGALSFMPIMGFVGGLFMLAAVKKRSKGFWYAGVIFFGLIVLSALGQASIPPLFPLAIFVLALVPASREYIGISKKEKKESVGNVTKKK